MKITITGLNHEVQWKDVPGRRLQTEIEKFLKNSPVELIAEEAYRLPTTVGQRLAYKYDIPWLEVDMHYAERKEHGIDDGKRKQGPRLNDKMESTGKSYCYFCPEIDEVREKHWMARLERNGSVGSVLFICGLLHVNSLKEKWEYLGHIVERWNLHDTDWFRAVYGTYTIMEQDGERWCEVTT